MYRCLHTHTGATCMGMRPASGKLGKGCSDVASLRAAGQPCALPGGNSASLPIHTLRGSCAGRCCGCCACCICCAALGVAPAAALLAAGGAGPAPPRPMLGSPSLPLLPIRSTTTGNLPARCANIGSLLLVLSVWGAATAAAGGGAGASAGAAAAVSSRLSRAAWGNGAAAAPLAAGTSCFSLPLPARPMPALGWGCCICCWLLEAGPCCPRCRSSSAGGDSRRRFAPGSCSGLAAPAGCAAACCSRLRSHSLLLPLRGAAPAAGSRLCCC